MLPWMERIADFYAIGYKRGLDPVNTPFKYGIPGPCLIELSWAPVLSGFIFRFRNFLLKIQSIC